MQTTPHRRRPGIAIAVPLIVGIIGLTTLMNRPRFGLIHTVDVLQLIASGMCFGVALTAWALGRTRND